MKKILVPGLLLLLPFLYLAIIWNSLLHTVPVHFDLTGKADQYGSKVSLIWMQALLTGLALLVYVPFANLHRLVPAVAPPANSDRMQKIGLAILVFITAIQCWIIYSTRAGEILFSVRFVLVAVFLLFALIGNYMPNLKRNKVAGFRLPWTLNNETNWRKTHFLAGRFWFAGGLLGALVCLLLPFTTALVCLGTLLLLMLFLPAFYSYGLHKKREAEV